jgi:nascent polypeptide-associated complex subunit alpha
MMPNMDPRMMKQAMKRMGIQSQDLDARQVIIKLSDREIVIDNPNVTKINMMGTDSFQIAGEISERMPGVEISEDDISTVMEQANVSHDSAKKAIEEAEGDLAKAIIALKD